MGLLVLLLSGPAAAGCADLVLEDPDGGTARLSDYQGRWVVLNFWASGCSPCARVVGELNRFQEARPDAAVLGVTFERASSGELRRRADELGIGYPVLRLGGDRLAPLAPRKGLPATAVFDPRGGLAAYHTGPLTAEDLMRFIDEESARAGAGAAPSPGPVPDAAAIEARPAP